MAKLICQAKVDGVHSGPNANKAEFAMGFQLKNTDPCRNAKAQNSIKSNHLCRDPEIIKTNAICGLISESIFKFPLQKNE